MVFTFRICWVYKYTLTLVSSCNVYPLNKSLLPYLKAFISIDDTKVQIVCEHTKYFVKKIMHISVFLTYINQKVAFFDKFKTKRQKLISRQSYHFWFVFSPWGKPFHIKKAYLLILIGKMSFHKHYDFCLTLLLEEFFITPNNGLKFAIFTPHLHCIDNQILTRIRQKTDVFTLWKLCF